MNRQLQTAYWVSVWFRYYLWVEHRNWTNGLNRSKIRHGSTWFKKKQHFNAMRMKMRESPAKENLENQWCSKWYWVLCPPIKMYSAILDTIDFFVSRLGAMLTALICFWACFGWKDLKFYTMFIWKWALPANQHLIISPSFRPSRRHCAMLPELFSLIINVLGRSMRRVSGYVMSHLCGLSV